VIGDPGRNKPDLIVAIETPSLTPEHPVAKWVDQNYRPLWRTNSLVVMLRKGGELDRAQAIAQN
jgi:hypothetical protein